MAQPEDRDSAKENAQRTVERGTQTKPLKQESCSPPTVPESEESFLSLKDKKSFSIKDKSFSKTIELVKAALSRGYTHILSGQFKSSDINVREKQKKSGGLDEGVCNEYKLKLRNSASDINDQTHCLEISSYDEGNVSLQMLVTQLEEGNFSGKNNLDVAGIPQYSQKEQKDVDKICAMIRKMFEMFICVSVFLVDFDNDQSILYEIAELRRRLNIILVFFYASNLQDGIDHKLSKLQGLHYYCIQCEEGKNSVDHCIARVAAALDIRFDRVGNTNEKHLNYIVISGDRIFHTIVQNFDHIKLLKNPHFGWGPIWLQVDKKGRFAFSQNGGYMAKSENQYIYVYSLKEEKKVEQFVLEDDYTIVDMAFSPEGTFLSILSQQTTNGIGKGCPQFRLYNLLTGEYMEKSGQKYEHWNPQFSKNESFFALCDKETETLSIYNKSLKVNQTFPLPNNAIFSFNGTESSYALSIFQKGKGKTPGNLEIYLSNSNQVELGLKKSSKFSVNADRAEMFWNNTGTRMLLLETCFREQFHQTLKIFQMNGGTWSRPLVIFTKDSVVHCPAWSSSENEFCVLYACCLYTFKIQENGERHWISYPLKDCLAYRLSLSPQGSLLCVYSTQCGYIEFRNGKYEIIAKVWSEKPILDISWSERGENVIILYEQEGNLKTDLYDTNGVKVKEILDSCTETPQPAFPFLQGQNLGKTQDTEGHCSQKSNVTPRNVFTAPANDAEWSASSSTKMADSQKPL